MKLMIRNILILCLLVSCASKSSNVKTVLHIQVKKMKNAEENVYRAWNGVVCEKQGKLQPCGDSEEEIGKMIGGLIVFECSNNSSKSIELHLISGKPKRLSDQDMGYLFSNCTINGKTIVKTKVKKIGEGETFIYTAVLPSDAKTIEEALANGYELTSENSAKLAQVYELNLKEGAEGKEKRMKEEALAQSKRDAESKAALDAIKKNWAIKNYLGHKVFFSKADNLLVGEYVGMMNWFDATSNCRNQKMRLPNVDEAVSLSSNGLCPIVLENCGFPIWTSTSRHNDKNAQRNMIVGNDAWAVGNGQSFPSELKSELGVVCVK